LTVLLLAGMLAAGCTFHRAKKTTTSAPTTSKTVVAPDDSLTAKVAAYNAAGRFLVLNFPVSRMPRVDQTLFLYRGGLKVAEVKVTGPQRDNNIVADLVTGEAQVGDDVRDQ
jgi:hypothetical protein